MLLNRRLNAGKLEYLASQSTSGADSSGAGDSADAGAGTLVNTTTTWCTVPELRRLPLGEGVPDADTLIRALDRDMQASPDKYENCDVVAPPQTLGGSSRSKAKKSPPQSTSSTRHKLGTSASARTSAAGAAVRTDQSGRPKLNLARAVAPVHPLQRRSGKGPLLPFGRSIKTEPRLDDGDDGMYRFDPAQLQEEMKMTVTSTSTAMKMLKRQKMQKAKSPFSRPLELMTPMKRCAEQLKRSRADSTTNIKVGRSYAPSPSKRVRLSSGGAQYVGGARGGRKEPKSGAGGAGAGAGASGAGVGAGAGACSDQLPKPSAAGRPMWTPSVDVGGVKMSMTIKEEPGIHDADVYDFVSLPTTSATTTPPVPSRGSGAGAAVGDPVDHGGINLCGIEDGSNDCGGGFDPAEQGIARFKAAVEYHANDDGPPAIYRLRQQPRAPQASSGIVGVFKLVRGKHRNSHTARLYVDSDADEAQLRHRFYEYDQIKGSFYMNLGYYGTREEAMFACAEAKRRSAWRRGGVPVEQQFVRITQRELKVEAEPESVEFTGATTTAAAASRKDEAERNRRRGNGEDSSLSDDDDGDGEVDGNARGQQRQRRRVLGVQKYCGQYRAQIEHRSNTFRIGMYGDMSSAAAAYDIEAKKLGMATNNLPPPGNFKQNLKRLLRASTLQHVGGGRGNRCSYDEVGNGDGDASHDLQMHIGSSSTSREGDGGGVENAEAKDHRRQLQGKSAYSEDDDDEDEAGNSFDGEEDEEGDDDDYDRQPMWEADENIEDMQFYEAKDEENLNMDEDKAFRVALETFPMALRPVHQRIGQPVQERPSPGAGSGDFYADGDGGVGVDVDVPAAAVGRNYLIARFIYKKTGVAFTPEDVANKINALAFEAARFQVLRNVATNY